MVSAAKSPVHWSGINCNHRACSGLRDLSCEFFPRWRGVVVCNAAAAVILMLLSLDSRIFKRGQGLEAFDVPFAACRFIGK